MQVRGFGVCVWRSASSIGSELSWPPFLDKELRRVMLAYARSRQ